MVRLNERRGAIRARSLLLPRPPSPLDPMYGEAAEDELKNRSYLWRQTAGVELDAPAGTRRPALGAHACWARIPREITVLGELCWGNGCPDCRGAVAPAAAAATSAPPNPKAGRRCALTIGTDRPAPYRSNEPRIKELRTARNACGNEPEQGERGVRTDQSLPPVSRRRRAVLRVHGPPRTSHL